MDSSIPNQGYRNYDNDTTRRPSSLGKKLTVFVGILIAIGALVYIGAAIYRNLNVEDNENEEAVVAWAGNESPLAGIQFLTDNGLTYEQYADLYNQLTKYFKDHHEEYKYVEYVYDSFRLPDQSSAEEIAECVPDEDAEKYGEEELVFWSCDEEDYSSEPTILRFKLRADNDDEYDVEIELDNSKDTVVAHLYDASHKALI